ncbi:PilZ domain-containing protein [Blastococcus sp. DSM 46786]|uniref:PilZ domain-containing protein n=1 Tax=Blastococcus sp. DSM 46786 TaxID=1798227 RepID=UPI0008B813F4|nr:PilZ domain-containing protein [Blastococcus sp. DSM 46786]SEL94939.1 PilZ domain-containing protein [Blastococcus sp. DSM 46786]
MPENAGVDYPEARTVVDLLATSRGDVLISLVESADPTEIVVSIGEDRSRRRVRLDAGEHVEVIWRGPEELRSLPTELIAAELHPPQWRLRPVGPSTRGQRRSAVRAPLSLQVRMTVGPDVLHGLTVDISEGGIRALFAPRDPARAAAPAPAEQPSPAALTEQPAPAVPVEASAPGSPAEQAVTDDRSRGEAENPLRAGAVLPLVVRLEEGQELACRGKVIRRIPRQDGGIELSLRFVDMPERTQDLVRRHVFAELRSLRSRGLL